MGLSCSHGDWMGGGRGGGNNNNKRAVRHWNTLLRVSLELPAPKVLN